MMSKKMLRRLLSALAVSALPALAFAQGADDDDETIEEIVVTGTGVARTTFETPQSVVQFSEEDFRQMQFNSQADILTQLPGVARKTANVVLGEIYNSPDGVVVDTHVGRISKKLGLTDQKDPVKIEKQLSLDELADLGCTTPVLPGVMPLLNPATVVRWNTDKSYLADLEAAGIPTVLVSTGRDLTELVCPPRSMFVNFPMGKGARR